MTTLQSSVAGVLASFALVAAGHAKPLEEAMPVATLAENATIDRLIAANSANLSLINRQRDPFGLPVGGEILIPTTQPEIPVEKPIIPTLNEALQGLRVDGVSPASREFQIGTRVIKCGETLTLRHRNTVFEALVVEVSPQAVLFEDAKDGTKSALKLAIIPLLPELK